MPGLPAQEQHEGQAVTVYVSGNAIDAATLAQRMLDLHPMALNGHCLTCGAEDCGPRQVATLELRRYNQLPRRRPGSTRPELINLRRALAADR
jgi:hypothetical protein